MDVEKLRDIVMADPALKESFLKWMDQTRILIADLEEIECDPGQMLKLLRRSLTLSRLKYFR